MRQLKIRGKIIGGFILIVALTFIVRLSYIQIIKEYTSPFRNEVEFPERGEIMDRNNIIIAKNKNSYDLIVIPREIQSFDTLSLCKLAKIDIITFKERLKNARLYSEFRESIIAERIDEINALRIMELRHKFHGFDIRIKPTRYYPINAGSHVLGYLRKIDNNQIKNKKYTYGDVIGSRGVEAAYDDILRGKKGNRMVLINVHNQPQGKFENGLHDTASVEGKDIWTTLDINLQKYGEELMKNKRGAIVAIEPSTGEILSMISSPYYDPNLLTGKTRDSIMRILLHDKNNATLMNRTLSTAYPPGSTFKLINALIQLQEGSLKEDEKYVCNKILVYGGKEDTMHCHKHSSPITLPTAIARSCNPYFCDVFSNLFKHIQESKKLSKKEAKEKAYKIFRKHLISFGIGTLLNGDFTIEGQSGNIPTINYLDSISGYYDKNQKKWKNGTWSYETLFGMAIGQGHLTITPMQMANYTAIIANRGYYITPHIIDSIEGVNIDKQYKTKRKTSIDSKHFETIIHGMKLVMNDKEGTAKRSYIPSNIEVFGKTGTIDPSKRWNKKTLQRLKTKYGSSKMIPRNEKYPPDHSSFVAFASKKGNNPEIAIAVYVEHAGEGSKTATPIAILMIEKYINNEICKRNRILEEEIIKRDLNKIYQKIK